MSTTHLLRAGWEYLDGVSGKTEARGSAQGLSSAQPTALSLFQQQKDTVLPLLNPTGAMGDQSHQRELTKTITVQENN